MKRTGIVTPLVLIGIGVLFFCSAQTLALKCLKGGPEIKDKKVTAPDKTNTSMVEDCGAEVKLCITEDDGKYHKFIVLSR